jgi:PilZ domain
MSSTAGKAFKSAPDRRPRLHPRYRCDFPVLVSLFSGDGHQQLSGHSRDLSEGGIGILVAADLGPGEVVSRACSLPGAPEPWTVRAVLRYRRGYHYGFEFLSLTDRQCRVLLDHLPELERADF